MGGNNYSHPADSIARIAPTDSISVDSLSSKKKKKDMLDAPVQYAANDTMEFDMEFKKVALEGNASVKYQDIELNSAHIEFDMSKQKVYAIGRPDSVGVIQGKPEFKEKSETFTSQDITYNFKTKKGYIRDIKTEQSDKSYLHSAVTKRMDNGHIHMKGGKYTTCDLDHPHFYLALSKATSIPDDKIVSGPAYMVMADIPLPLGIPFGFFPNTKSYQSGILIPTFGESATKGFSLSRGGFYWYINDKMDMTFLGDVYSLGSWGGTVQTNYKVRYKYNGNFMFRYYDNVYGERGTTSFSESKDFAVSWNHTQDSKANPTSTFSAHIDYSTSSFDKQNSYSQAKAMNNIKRSSVSYSKRWDNFNLSGGMTHSQNSLNKSVNVSFPRLSLSMNTLYPLQKKESVGKAKWYESLSVGYSANLENSVSTKDSLLFKREVLDLMDNGFQHSIPVALSLKLFKNFTLSPSLNYTGVAYTKSMSLDWDENYLNDDGSHGKIDTTFHNGMKYAQAFYPSISAGWTPKLSGIYTFRSSKVQAMRHVVSPSLGFSFTPDVSSFNPDYYRTVQHDSLGRMMDYSIYSAGRYGTPLATKGKSGTISFNLRNTFELKVMPTDTSTKAEKVSLLDNFDFSTSYNVFADSMNLSPIQFNTSSKLFKDKVNVSGRATFDPYAIDKKYRRYNQFEWEKNHRLARLTNASISLTTSFSSSEGKKEGDNGGDKSLAPPVLDDNGKVLNQQELLNQEPVDFSIPWNFSASYSMSYTKTSQDPSIVNTLNFSGGLNLTKKWKIGFSSGYDIESMKVTHADFNFSRDLHCWTFKFDWVPFGFMQSYFLSIRVNAQQLSDLKYEKRRSFYDSEY
jgi:lipopolysaccharide assembly outer membrane protein LptD (OstA)